LVLDEVAVDGPQGRIVHPTSFALRPGLPLALLGETGSGKSLLMQAVMGTLPPGLVARGSVRLDLVTRQEVMERLRDALAESGAALLLVTHDPDIGAKVADRVLRLGPEVAPLREVG
jgi:peptide/nickel transport system ATP-binding protein